MARFLNIFYTSNDLTCRYKTTDMAIILSNFIKFNLQISIFACELRYKIPRNVIFRLNFTCPLLVTFWRGFMGIMGKVRMVATCILPLVCPIFPVNYVTCELRYIIL